MKIDKQCLGTSYNQDHNFDLLLVCKLLTPSPKSYYFLEGMTFFGSSQGTGRTIEGSGGRDC